MNKLVTIFGALLFLIVFTVGCEQASDPASDVEQQIALEQPDVNAPALPDELFEAGRANYVELHTKALAEAGVENGSKSSGAITDYSNNHYYYNYYNDSHFPLQTIPISSFFSSCETNSSNVSLA